MATNQDILSFLKAEKESRVKEKLEEKAAREKEREQDLAKISEMIKAGVKDEVQTALKPIEERLTEQEKVTEGLGGQIVELLSHFEAFKGQVKTSLEFPALPPSSGGTLADRVNGVVNRDEGGVHERAFGQIFGVEEVLELRVRQ